MTDNRKAPLIVTTNAIRDGRVLLQVLPRPATGTVGADIAARQDPGRRACSRAENDKLLLKARLIVANSTDGATTLHSLNIDRQQVATLSSTALVFVLGRLGGYFESGNLFSSKEALSCQTERWYLSWTPLLSSATRLAPECSLSRPWLPNSVRSYHLRKYPGPPPPRIARIVLTSFKR
jgi:hypothetical protein